MFQGFVEIFLNVYTVYTAHIYIYIYFFFPPVVGFFLKVYISRGLLVYIYNIYLGIWLNYTVFSNLERLGVLSPDITVSFRLDDVKLQGGLPTTGEI